MRQFLLKGGWSFLPEYISIDRMKKKKKKQWGKKMEISGFTRMLQEFCLMIAVWIFIFKGVQPPQPHVPYAYGYLFK